MPQSFSAPIVQKQHHAAEVNVDLFHASSFIINNIASAHIGNNHSTMAAHNLPESLDEKSTYRRSLASLESECSTGGEMTNRQQEKDEHVTDADEDTPTGSTLAPVRSAQPSVRDISKIPNGGLWAWLQVLGGFFLMFNSWGVINTFGTYQAYYETQLLTSSTPSSISWIGSIQSFLLLFVGALTGPVYDAGYFRELLIVGTVLLVLGQMMIGLCHAYWQILLAQAFCIGIGTGCFFVPSIAILSTYFSTRIGTAIGIVASGSSIGGVIYPVVFHKLLPQIGFAWATRVLGFMFLATMVIPITCMRTRVLPAKARSLLDLRAFLIPAYSLQVVGFFVGFMGLYMPFFYAQLYAIQEKITNQNLAFYLIAILNSTSVFGRIVPNLLSDRIGPYNAVIPCTIMSAITCLCFMAVSSTAGIVVLMAFYGFFSGCFVSIPPTIMVHLSADALDKIGTRLGQGFGCVALGLLIGTPIGGTILDKSGFNGSGL
ncbi:major facilitator superfamily protein [Pyrenophora tritici-repentis]|uniref:Major facilitator superfamily (MFS) profile domain-containing protein n=1 Tax=Pyrenophora tritici-repentis (strain Pt-1C-BFP) TaxID=426418 RepID=B2WF78_PYRTR|nr:uncharacterized protein PTRG_08239 [Pyrenophora tritici-repentis Pt-1C-BFP]KAF7443580.1 major facilitator superfamily protein [Pyrenophora tritici-repentis]EDU51158.1 conserved hypothetical protein [Pyrenophora tritici-repentis Pt-1C-BFP]KAG9379320.1 major facilitator superfamily protein [Pyrenophora tritici-repentis]KAI1525201.1 major facilitator superfamily protein [Pyrenophora tritici-repentis]KAI1563670.1 major facilitator superfamily protein [Pyrenophora tritici-repentis]